MSFNPDSQPDSADFNTQVGTGDSQAVPSSPLFFPSSSNPPSEVGAPTPQHGFSSPLHYSSSAPNSDFGREVRTGRAPAVRARQRGDIHSSDVTSSPMRRRFFVDGPLSSSGLHPLSSSSVAASERGDEPVRVIWGTNVSIQECSNLFRTFLMSFKQKHRQLYNGQPVAAGDNELFYVAQFKQMRELGLTNLNLDAVNLLAYGPARKLYHQLVNYPQEVVPIMDQTVKDVMVALVMDAPDARGVEEIETNLYKIRPFNIESKTGLRELNPNDIDKLVSIKGLVLRSTPVIPDMKVAFFRCAACDHTTMVEIDRGVIQEPTRCPRNVCRQPNSMALVHNRCSFADKQVLKLQETPDAVPDGQTPHLVSLCVYDELVDSCRAGDRVEVCGIFRSLPVRVNAGQRSLKNLFKTYIDVVHIKKVNTKRMTADPSTRPEDIQDVQEVRQLSEADVVRVKATASRTDLYELLSRSLAPSIYEMEDVKKGVLLQLFGGANKEFKKGGKYRGDINILLCGDPSTSKSQLLQYVHKIAPRGVYTSGKGSSAVGLTAYVTRDPDTRQLVLESGALVLSDGGVCCIDEFDKMSDSTRLVLHEVMEQQTISIAKAGIITTLNARTSILASANPINSRYDPNLPVTSNIALPPPLLSRFDLVYLILDRVDENLDRRLAQHLTSMYLEDTPDNVAATEILPVEFLTLYIQYAKENINPVLNEESKNELVKCYVEMRKMGEDVRAADKRITATTRQLESMIRLAEAHAKMRLSQVVELADVQEAVRLIKTAIKDYATDPLTGRIDMDLIQTGRSSAQRKLQEDLVKELLRIINLVLSISYADLLKRINEQSQEGVDNSELSNAVDVLLREEKVRVNGEGHGRMITFLRS